EKSTIVFNSRKISCEQIEAGIKAIAGVKSGLAVATPFRGGGDATDQLAVFFVPRTHHDLDQLGHKILRHVAHNFGVTVSHLVPLKEAELPLTPTGKVSRHDLVELYRPQELRALSLQREQPNDGPLTPRQAGLARMWQSLLK